jgi:hypothetical protein
MMEFDAAFISRLIDNHFPRLRLCPLHPSSLKLDRSPVDIHICRVIDKSSPDRYSASLAWRLVQVSEFPANQPSLLELPPGGQEVTLQGSTTLIDPIPSSSASTLPPIAIATITSRLTYLGRHIDSCRR